MHIVNLTPHPIHIYAPDAPDIVTDEHAPIHTIPASGQVARIATTRTQAGTVPLAGLEIPLGEATYGAVEGIPDPRPGTLWLVSLPCATEMRWSGRDDLVVVDRLVRNAENTVVGARGFGRVTAEQAIDPSTYDYPHKNPRGILAGKPWEDLVDGARIRVESDLRSEFGTVTLFAGRECIHLHAEAAAGLHAALGYARARAGAQPCPDCPETLAPAEGPVWSCVNGHRYDVEVLLARLKTCTACNGYGNAWS